MKRKRLRTVVISGAGLFLAFALADALGLFSTTSYTAISHGNHTHYTPDNRDDGVELGNCPQRPPGPDEMLTPQCQLVRAVDQNGTTYYIPSDADGQMPITQFPTRPPASGERILPNGQLVTAE